MNTPGSTSSRSARRTISCDGEIDVLGESELSAERHRQAADDGPAGADGIEVLSRLPEDRVDGLRSAKMNLKRYGHCALLPRVWQLRNNMWPDEVRYDDEDEMTDYRRLAVV